MLLQLTRLSYMQVDMDYRYTLSGDNNISINVRSPYPVSTELNMASGSRQASAVVNWDSTSQNRQIRFDFGFKNIKTPSLTERALSFKSSVLRRTVGFAFGYNVTSDHRLRSHGELLWNADPRPDFTYDLDLQPDVARLQVSSFLFNTDSSLSHRKINRRRQYVTEAVLDLSERLTIRSDLNLENGIIHRVTVQHPRLSRVCMSFLVSAVPCIHSFIHSFIVNLAY